MEYLYGKDMTELRRLCEELSLPRFAAGQIARWLYRRHTTDAAAMTDLPAAARVRLAERCDTGLSAPVGVSTSSDGTKKYLFRTVQGHFIESAYIPDGDRATLCVSSQAGCRMAAVSAPPAGRDCSIRSRRPRFSIRSSRCPNATV